MPLPIQSKLRFSLAQSAAASKILKLIGINFGFWWKVCSIASRNHFDSCILYPVYDVLGLEYVGGRYSYGSQLVQGQNTEPELITAFQG